VQDFGELFIDILNGNGRFEKRLVASRSATFKHQVACRIAPISEDTSA
jgi:hypothetical protein